MAGYYGRPSHGVNYGRLVRMFEQLGPEKATETFAEMLEAKDLDYRNIDLGRLFVECFGWHNFLLCRSREKFVFEVQAEALQEANGAVNSSAFHNITGQIVYSAIMEPYNAVAHVFTPLIPEVKTEFLQGEKIPGVTEIGDEIAERAEGDPYALAGVGEDWIFTPSIKDRGVIVPVTWEAIFGDRTGKVLDRCGDVGKWGGRNREKRAIDCVIDENTTRHRYNWRGTTIASYGDNSGNHSWDNLVASNGLVDWTDLDAAEQLLNAITDPYTGEVVDVEARHLIVTKQLEQVANRILSATELRVATPGYATAGNPTLTNFANPYLNKYQVVSSKLLAPRLATDTDWFLGDIGAYARYMVAERANVVQAPPNTEAEFHRRIVAQFRFNERGEYVVVQPRAIIKSTA